MFDFSFLWVTCDSYLAWNLKRMDWKEKCMLISNTAVPLQSTVEKVFTSEKAL